MDSHFGSWPNFICICENFPFRCKKIVGGDCLNEFSLLLVDCIVLDDDKGDLDLKTGQISMLN